jgi:glycine/D-amino acid oxidase-like deaminating enzyme
MHLAKKLVASGIVNIQTYTPAISIKAAAKEYDINTPRGKILACQIIHANNAYVSALLPEYAKKNNTLQ